MSGRVPNIARARKAALAHTVSKPANKFVHKRTGRIPGDKTSGFVQLKDRIARFNIVKGDKVRITVGSPKDKFNDPVRGAESGWRIYTVEDVKKSKNRIYLKGLTNKKANAPRPLPADFDQMSPEHQREWTEQKNYVYTQRPVQYSNVQLCVEEAGTESVFATRVATSAPWFDRASNKYIWNRYAAKLSSETSVAPDEKRGLISIPWPKQERDVVEEPSAWDTLAEEAQRVSLRVSKADELPSTLVPSSMRAPPPSDQAWADEYVFNPDARRAPIMQAAMPLYLGEELSPRFSRAKQQRGWTERRLAEAEARERAVQTTLEEWEKNGRDKGITELLSHPMVGLEGVHIRPRTREEIRQAAAMAFDEEVRIAKRSMASATAAGKVYDYDAGEWREGAKGEKLEKKRSRKARKERKVLARLEALTLSEEKNQFVPPDVAAVRQ